MFTIGKQVYNRRGELLGTVLAVLGDGCCVKVQPPVGSSVEQWTQVYDKRDLTGTSEPEETEETE